MTIDEVKEELKSYKDDCKLINNLEEQISVYDSKINSCTSQISDMPKGSPIVQDKMAEYIAELEDLKTKKYAYLVESEKKKKLIEETIFKLKQPFKTLLHLTYISENSLTETAYKMGYTYKHMCKLHGKALISYMRARDENVSYEASENR